MKDKILKEILNIKDPESGQSLEERNLIEHIHISDKNINVKFKAPSEFSLKSSCVYIGRKIKQIIYKLCAYKEISVTICCHVHEDEINDIISKS